MTSTGIERVAVLGAGTMGPGLALSYALHGFEVRIWSIDPALLTSAASVVEKSLETLARAGVVADEAVPAAIGRIAYHERLEDCVDGADYVVEAIVENVEAKRQLFRRLDEILPPEVIVASNTSVLDVFELMPENRLSRAVIAHWFAPPHVVPLVEVVKCAQTSQATIDTTMTLLREIGKTPILLRTYVPGFVINRLQMILNKEVFHLLDNDFISAEELDEAVRASLAPRMMVLGLVQRIDFGGLDISARNIENRQYEPPADDPRPRSLFEHVDRGELGVKTGRGFFDYGGRSIESLLEERDEKLLAAFACARTCGGIAGA